MLLTEKFPGTSNRVNKYMFPLYEYYINSIVVCTMKSRIGSGFILVFKDLHVQLLIRGVDPVYTQLEKKS